MIFTNLHKNKQLEVKNTYKQTIICQTFSKKILELRKKKEINYYLCKNSINFKTLSSFLFIL